jgi:hypothetical protein
MYRTFQKRHFLNHLNGGPGQGQEGPADPQVDSKCMPLFEAVRLPKTSCIQISINLGVCLSDSILRY